MESLCKRCDTVLPSEARICSCGYPTPKASFKERTEYEVRQWKTYKVKTAQSA